MCGATPSRCIRLHVAVLNTYCVNAMCHVQPITDKAVKGKVAAVSPLAVLFTYKVRYPVFVFRIWAWAWAWACMLTDSLCRSDSSEPTPTFLLESPLPPFPSLWYLLTISCRLPGNHTARIILEVFKCKVLGFFQRIDQRSREGAADVTL